ncbi:MAG: ammonia-forming cytochrome c nitrite reductase subunit c552 [Deltaproteobacteria bacterium]|nr:ammonia-forming cytochrome c nitrite reductase subunit c552 [Deltaproteobacteria bacterium]
MLRFRLRQKLLLWVAGSSGLLVLLVLAGRFFPFSRDREKAAPAFSLDQEIGEFFKEYWQRPIAPQGPSPPGYTEKEASLRPEACGGCHVRQYADWEESLHSKAMGPGPWGQIIDLDQNSPGEASLCRSCHAPLSEQSPVLAKKTERDETTYEENPRFDSELQLQGIACAACHVRQHQRFGPPKGEETSAATYPPGTPNHGGIQRTPYFERAEFCKDCHQFDPQNSLLVNGKPLQDTYREWQNSIWGKGGASCQECHMPQRRHLWKGIHDAEWVKGGVRIETQIRRDFSRRGDALELSVEVVNAAVGHKFPTYITPKVFVRAALLDSRGKTLPRTEQVKIIGWDARFEEGQWKEYFDTRITPGESFRGTFRWSRLPQAKKIRAWVEVHPDHFYHVHFYPAYLKGGNLSPEGRRLVEKALHDSGRTPYVLFEKVVPLS